MVTAASFRYTEVCEVVVSTNIVMERQNQAKEDDVSFD
jgi:hypothetical protein